MIQRGTPISLTCTKLHRQSLIDLEKVLTDKVTVTFKCT